VGIQANTKEKLRVRQDKIQQNRRAATRWKWGFSNFAKSTESIANDKKAVEQKHRGKQTKHHHVS